MILPTMPRSQIKKETCWEHAVFFQAVGNHTKAEVTEMASKDLRALSLYLGNRMYSYVISTTLYLITSAYDRNEALFHWRTASRGGLRFLWHFGSNSLVGARFIYGETRPKYALNCKINCYTSLYLNLKLSTGELPNLVEFCERMKAKFWPDWNQCLGRREILDKQLF